MTTRERAIRAWTRYVESDRYTEELPPMIAAGKILAYNKAWFIRREIERAEKTIAILRRVDREEGKR